ncbi:MAG: hypothetical protein GY835_27540 [bacterium]|nr:hypothetical protein [bacterium]
MAQKILVISGRDDWIIRFVNSVNEPFFDSLRGLGFLAVICSNFSAYRHVEHKVWLDNRAAIRNFLQSLLEREIPGVFFSYLEDSPLHLEWLVRHFELNPSQDLVATGFDRGGANDINTVRRRLDILSEVQEKIGRPLRVVLANIVTRLPAIRMAAERFPGRVHLLGQSVVLRSVKGSLLECSSHPQLKWRETAFEYKRGFELFEHNARILEEAVSEVPGFFCE